MNPCAAVPAAVPSATAPAALSMFRRVKRPLAGGVDDDTIAAMLTLKIPRLCAVPSIIVGDDPR